MKAELKRWTGYGAASALDAAKGGGWYGKRPARPPAKRTGHGGIRLDPRPGLDRRHRDSSDHGQPDQQRLFQRRRRSRRVTRQRSTLGHRYRPCPSRGWELELAPNSVAWLSSVAGRPSRGGA